MSPSRPYLLRALHEWIVDNAATPQIVVDGTHADVQVPENLRSTEKIVLNLSPSAVKDLEIDREYVSFVARFSGRSFAVIVPIDAVQAIYARENGQGMMFPDEAGTQPSHGEDRAPGPTAVEDDSGTGPRAVDRKKKPGATKKQSGKSSKPDLKVIK
ncbi:MAG: ClpXP protease specificity-enhancing factor [Wenzhouxiangellaceae bacterium]